MVINRKDIVTSEEDYGIDNDDFLFSYKLFKIWK
jgi:hypothetical protein